MSEAPLILGVSGLRGIVGESLTPEVAVRYAGAFGSWLQEKIENRSPFVLIARDGRVGGESTYTAAISGLLATGCRVRRLGIATTPTAGMQCDLVGADAAVIITASHNPQEWNGLKLLIRSKSWSDQTSDGRGVVEGTESDACAPDVVTAEEIVARFRAGQISWWAGQNCKDSTVDDDVEDPHCLRVLSACERAMDTEDFWDWFEERLRPRIVVDSVNSSGSVMCRVMFEGTPCHLVSLFGENTGEFPHTPEPTKENLSGEGGLCDAVPGLKSDVGFAQDPDADRLAIVDEQGNYIGEEYTLVLCAAALMEGRKGDPETARAEARGSLKPVFVVNLSTSRMIDDVAAHYGAEVVRTPVGEANVVERMKQLKAQGRDVVMGGEGNGGVIWPEVTYVRDSLSAMALTLALMARTGKKVSELVAMVDAMGPGKKGYCILKRKAPLASKADAVPVVEHLARVYRGEAGAVVDTQDGVRIDWPARGVWAHVRASNTEPIMRVIVEAPTEALATDTAQAVEARIAEV